jgi:hypothetical protein
MIKVFLEAQMCRIQTENMPSRWGIYYSEYKLASMNKCVGLINMPRVTDM